jgi:hypothetical protein
MYEFEIQMYHPMRRRGKKTEQTNIGASPRESPSSPCNGIPTVRRLANAGYQSDSGAEDPKLVSPLPYAFFFFSFYSELLNSTMTATLTLSCAKRLTFRKQKCQPIRPDL